MATSADMREFFRVFREEINRAENKLETSVVTKVKELESKIEMLEKKVHKLSGKPARPEEEKSGATYQSTSADARKLYGDIRPGDITHEKVQLRFVEYFSKTRRRFPSYLVTDANYSHHQYLPCYLIQLAYDSCRDQLIECLLSELLTSFFNDQGFVMDDKFQDVMRVLNMLAKSTAEFQQLQTSMSNPTKAKSKVKRLLRVELLKLFKQPTADMVDCVGVDHEEWQNRTGAFGILLSLANVRKLVPQSDHLQKQAVEILSEDQGKGLSQELSDVPALLQECVDLCWDMVTLNPPALVSQPSVFNEMWLEARATKTHDETANAVQVYYRPVLFYSAKLDVAVKGEVKT